MILLTVYLMLLVYSPASHSARSESSIYLEEVNNKIDESKKTLDEMKSHLEKAKKTLGEWKKHADKASSAKEYFKKIPRQYRPVSEAKAKKIFEMIKSGSGFLKQGQKWLGDRIKQVEKVKKLNKKASGYIKKVRKWDPENSSNNPYYGLEMISSILSEGAKKFPHPLNKFVSGYADATKAFVKQLKGLQKKIEDRGQGSVCINMASKEKIALANYISKKTTYDCAFCSKGDFWALFKKYSVITCSAGGTRGDGGYILYNGSGTKDKFHDIPNRQAADVVYQWMSSEGFAKYRKSIKFLKTYINAYQRDRKKLLKEMRVLSNWRALEKYHECTGKEIYNQAIELAQSDDYNDYLKYAITDKSHYERDKKKVLNLLRNKVIIRGWTEQKGKNQKIAGASVSIQKSEKGSAIATVRSKGSGMFCFVPRRDSLSSSLFISGKKDDLSGIGVLEIEPELFAYSKVLILSKDAEEEDDDSLSGIIAETEEIEKESEEDKANKDEEEKDEFTTIVPPKGPKGKGDKGKDKDKPGEDEKGEDKGATDNPLVAFCQQGIQDARAARDEFVSARDRFRNAFETENSSTSCSSVSAGYYYVEMRRAAHKMRAILRALQAKLKLTEGEENKDLKWCRSKLRRGAEILDSMQTYRKNVYSRYRDNNCNVDRIVRDGERQEPGLLPNEIESKEAGTAGMWLASSSDPEFAQVPFAPQCISEKLIALQASALGSALAKQSFANSSFTPVISTTISSNRFTIQITGTVVDNKCTASFNIKFDTTLGESTGTQIITYSMKTSGKDCAVNSISKTYTINLTKVSDTCQ